MFITNPGTCWTTGFAIDRTWGREPVYNQPTTYQNAQALASASAFSSKVRTLRFELT